MNKHECTDVICMSYFGEPSGVFQSVVTRKNIAKEIKQYVCIGVVLSFDLIQSLTSTLACFLSSTLLEHSYNITRLCVNILNTTEK